MATSWATEPKWSPNNIPDPLTMRVQALCQELQDMILDFLVAQSSDKAYISETHYKPPLGLQINRAIREKTAKDFYSNTCFMVRYDELRLPAAACMWLRSLQACHRLLINEICIETNYSDMCLSADEHAYVLDEVWESVQRQGFDLRDHDVLWLPFTTNGSSTTKWFKISQLDELPEEFDSEDEQD